MSSQKILNLKCYLFEKGASLNIGRWNNNLVKMATLEEEKAHRTVIQFCVQTGMTQTLIRNWNAQTDTVVFRGALFLNDIVNLVMVGLIVHSIDGNHTWMSVMFRQRRTSLKATGLKQWEKCLSVLELLSLVFSGY